MKFNFILFLVISVSTSVAQNPIHATRKTYEQNTHKLMIPRQDSLQKEKLYIESIDLCRKCLCDTSCRDRIDELYYRLAMNFAIVGDKDSSFYYLNKYIDVSTDDRVIIADTIFYVLRNDSTRWKSMIKRIENGYLDCIKSVTDKDFALKLFYMGIEDQLYRVYRLALRQMEVDSNGHFVYFVPHVAPDLIELEKYMKEKGFPTISAVGHLGSSNAFLIIQHSNRIVKNFHFIRKAFKNNEFDSLNYALIKDRYLMDLHRKQLYGTQLIQNRKTQKKYPGKFVLYPVRDFKNVNTRRANIGFKTTVEEYVASWNSETHIIPEEYYKHRKKKNNTNTIH